MTICLFISRNYTNALVYRDVTGTATVGAIALLTDMTLEERTILDQIDGTVLETVGGRGSVEATETALTIEDDDEPQIEI
jgi:hypothetical protein